MINNYDEQIELQDFIKDISAKDYKYFTLLCLLYFDHTHKKDKRPTVIGIGKKYSFYSYYARVKSTSC